MTAVALSGVLAASLPANAQSGTPVTAEQKHQSPDGSFSINFRSQKVSQQQLEQAMAGLLGMGKQTSFKEMARKTGSSGLTHIAYQQYFKGIPVQDGMVLVHLKNGLVTSANGVALPVPDDYALPASRMSAEQAIAAAQRALSITALLNRYPAELVITRNTAEGQTGFVTAWRVRIDGRNADGKVKMNKVFVNAENGALINTYPLINESDVTANAETLYQGVRTITADSYQGGYRLRDSARKVYTYNAGGVEPTGSFSQNPFVEDVDYVSATQDWGKVLTLNTFSIDTLGSASFLSGVGQSAVLVTAVAHGGLTSIDDADVLTMNYTFSASMPVIAQGLQVQVEDDSLSGAIAKVDFNGNPLDSLAFPMSDTSVGVHHWNDTAGNAGTYTMEMAKNPALDAHWGMEMTHDYYKQIFNRDSYDGQGSKVRNYVNGTMMMMGTQTNAAALPDPYNSMVYGMGDGVTMGPVVGLDVMGHEFTHMVTDHNGFGGLNYQDESGALNESFSDMMGVSIRFFADSSIGTWTIGEGVVLEAPYYMRSMSEPNGPANAGNSFTRQPDTYHGTFWYSGQQDDGGVHINSGVPNKWYYLLSEGGSGTNDNNYQYQVTGQGLAKAEQIAYATFTQYLTPSATMVDAYYGSLDAATDLYGAHSPEYIAVQHAWWAVGVPNNDDSTTAITTVKSHSDYVSVYPNPASTTVTISSTWQQPIEMVIYSITGAKVQTISVPTGRKAVDISALSKGTYFIKYRVSHQTFAEKLTVI